MKISRHLITGLCATVLLFGACKNNDDSNNSGTNTGKYSFEYTIDGDKYQWSGGIPGPTQGQCTYTITDDKASLGMTRDAPGNPNYNPIVLVVVPTGTGTFKLNQTTADNSSHGFSISLGQTESVIHGQGTEITFTINEISGEQFGTVTGTFSGTAVKTNFSTQEEKIVNVSGKFTACKLN